jgi:hypothetical protein
MAAKSPAASAPKPKSESRDSAGRFAPGWRGGGRRKAEIPASVLRSRPLEEIVIIRDEAKEQGKLDIALRANERLAEYLYGKPKQELDIDARADISAEVVVKFVGEVDGWSK